MGAKNRFLHTTNSKAPVQDPVECVTTAASSSSGSGIDTDNKEGLHGKKKLWVKIKEQYELVEFQALPDYLRDNEYILKYYRADWPLKHTLLSIFSVHNETLNIWTHLLGFIIFLALTIYAILSAPGGSSGWEKVADLDKIGRNLLMAASSSSTGFGGKSQQQGVEQALADGVVRWPFFVFLLGAMTCLLTSSTCHLLSCHSRQLSSVMWRLDYAGIAVMIATSFYPPIYYVFQCQRIWQFVYLTGISVLGIGAVCVTVIPCLHSPRYRIFRTMLFLSMGLSGVIPGAHALVQNWHEPMCLLVLGYELAMVFFYLLGTFIYAARIPERWKPGLFDIAGHSHQIFHVMVILGAYAHYEAALIFINWRAAQPASRDLERGRRVHSEIRASPHQKDRFLANLLVRMYGRCGDVDEARRVFESIQRPNLYSWSLLLTAFADNGYRSEAEMTFNRMDERDICCWNGMISLISKESTRNRAQEWFNRMPGWDAVSVNAMIQANASNGHVAAAKELFDAVQSPNLLSCTALIQGFVCEGQCASAERVFVKMPHHDSLCSTAMIQGFGQAGDVSRAKQMFDDHLPIRDIVSWTAMLIVYAENGLVDHAARVFNLAPALNVVSFTGMIVAFAQNLQLPQAKQLFDSVPERNDVSWNAAIAAWAKNGNFSSAGNLFNAMPAWNSVSWLTMVAEYAHHGHGNEAVDLFRVISLEGVALDSSMFLTLLMACSHAGLVEEGWQWFKAMGDHGIGASKEHFGALVSLLCRAGRVEDAEDVIRGMPYQPSAVEWGAFLSGCKLERDIVKGSVAAQHLLVLESDNTSPCVLLAEMCWNAR